MSLTIYRMEGCIYPNSLDLGRVLEAFILSGKMLEGAGTRMFKYQNDLQKISTSKVPCPPASAKEMAGPAWRWVKNPVVANCFDPVATKNPPRLLRAQKDGPTQECSCWGLSMHATKPQSIEAFQQLEKSVSNARKIFGGHVSGATLNASHGKGTSPTSNGHFDLHPYNGVDFLTVFLTCEAIP